MSSLTGDSRQCHDTSSGRTHTTFEHATELAFEPTVKLGRVVFLDIYGGTHRKVDLGAFELLKLSREWESPAHKLLGFIREAKQPPELSYRDIRKIVLGRDADNPGFVVRKNCIILSLFPVIAVIFDGRLLLNLCVDSDMLGVGVSPEDYAALVSQLEAATKRASRSRSVGREPAAEEPTPSSSSCEKDVLPYEFMVLEILMNFALNILRAVVDHVEERAQPYTKLLDGKKLPSYETIRKLYPWLTEVAEVLDKIRGIEKDTLGILQDEADMRFMELKGPEGLMTAVVGGHHGKYLSRRPNPQLEILLEYFAQETCDLENRLRRLLKCLTYSENLIQVKLMTSKVNTQNFTTLGVVMTTGLDFGNAFSGLWGANLLNRLEENPFAFYLCFGIAVVCSISCVFSCIHVCSVHHGARARKLEL